VLDEWISVARRCWTGTVEPFEGRFYRLAEAIFCRPTPARHVPVLIGGMSRYAQERAGRIGDGWLAQYSLDDLSESGIADGLAVLREAGTRAGRPPAELDGFRIVVRVTGADRKLDVLATRLESLAGAGATELVGTWTGTPMKGPPKALTFSVRRSHRTQIWRSR